MRIQILRFAHDITIIVQNEINLKRALESLDDILKSSYKMKINGIKTEVLVCFKDPENFIITMDGDALKQVTKFKYLGSILTEEGKNKEYIIQQVRKAKVMFNNKKQLLCSNNVSLEIKKETYKKLYLKYCSLWIRNMDRRKNEERVVNAFETWSWRRMLKIKWTDRITKDEGRKKKVYF